MLVRATASRGVVVKIGEGLPYAAFEQGAENRAVNPGEPGVVGQVTEDRAVVFDKGGRMATLPAGRGVQLGREGVIDLVRLAVLVGALGVACPAGHDGRRAGEG